MSAYQQGQAMANAGKLRPAAGSDSASQQRQKGFDDQTAKNNANKT